MYACVPYDVYSNDPFYSLSLWWALPCLINLQQEFVLFVLDTIVNNPEMTENNQ